MQPFRWNHVSVGVAASPERLQPAQVFVLVDGAIRMMGGLVAVSFPRRPRISLLSSMGLRQVLGDCGVQVSRHRSHQVRVFVSGGGVSQKAAGVRSVVRGH